MTEVLAVDEWTPDEAAAHVTQAMEAAVESIVEVGRRLIEAKSRVAHGGWLKVVEQLPISERTCQKYMQIATHPDIQIRSTATDLPASWYTLSLLAQLPPGEVTRLVDDGALTPETTRAQAQEWVDQVNAAAQQGLNEWSAACDSITAAVGYFRAGFIPPNPMPDGYPSVAEALARAKTLVADLEGL